MIRAIIVLVAAAALAGCSQPASTAPAPFAVPTPRAAAPPTPAALTPEEEAFYGPRVELPGGLLQKQIGKVAQYGGPDDEDNSTWGVRVVIDSIELDPKCDRYASKPERGHRLVLTMRVETSQAYDATRENAPSFFEWSTIGPDGITEAPMNSSPLCRAAAELPFDLRPNAKYRGTVVVDTANTSGQLVLNNWAAWKFPA